MQMSTAARKFVGGMRAGGMGASRPLISVSVNRTGVSLGPRWRLLEITLPTYEFAWRDVERVVELRGLFGAPVGVRFVLRGPARVRGGYAVPWRSLVRRLEVWLSAADTEAALAKAPRAIPRSQRRSVLFWPERRPRTRAR